MQPVVHSVKLSKWYGQVIAVNNVSVDIGPGITALLGPNGAGKSTLISMFTGQLRPTQGKLEILGEDVWANPELNLRVGLCHQYDNFYEDMTAVEFLTLVGRLNGFSGRAVHDQVRVGLQVVGLDEKAWKRPIRTYSKGMRQRVKLAQALMHDPDLLLLDEPMTGLDPVGRREIADLIRERARLGKSVIVSTHILHEVETLTDQILLLAQGRVLAEGDIHVIRESLETHPYAIKVVCSQPRRVAELMAARPHVSAVEVFEDRPPHHVVLRTTRADLIFEELPGLVLDEDITVDEISSPDDNLEAVFDYLVG